MSAAPHCCWDSMSPERIPSLPAPSSWAPSYLALLPPRVILAMLFHVLQVSVEFVFPERDIFSSSRLLPRRSYILPEAALSLPCSPHHVLCVCHSDSPVLTVVSVPRAKLWWQCNIIFMTWTYRSTWPTTDLAIRQTDFRLGQPEQQRKDNSYNTDSPGSGQGWKHRVPLSCFHIRGGGSSVLCSPWLPGINWKWWTSKASLAEGNRWQLKKSFVCLRRHPLY